MDKASDSIQNIEQTFSVPLPAEEAFTAFTHGLSTWWPREYTWAGDVLETIEIEPHKGGRCFERGPHGFECDWGRVLIWEPPHRIVLTWQISPNRVPEPDPEKASEVEVLFKPVKNGGTRLHFEHRKFNNHGEEAEAYQKALSSPEGWPYILNCFKEAVAGLKS